MNHPPWTRIEQARKEGAITAGDEAREAGQESLLFLGALSTSAATASAVPGVVAVVVVVGVVAGEGAQERHCSG